MSTSLIPAWEEFKREEQDGTHCAICGDPLKPHKRQLCGDADCAATANRIYQRNYRRLTRSTGRRLRA